MIPAGYSKLTGGVGYTYGLTATPPLVQTNLPAYPTNPALNPAFPGRLTGGLIVPAWDVWKAASAADARRPVVDNARCNACHVLLGAAPTFHAGQRNDGPTCTFCHNVNQNNNGWAGNEKDFIHALHAGTQAGVTLPDGSTLAEDTGIRAVPFGWHAESASDGFWDVTFPSPRNHCEACHLPGTYDFSASASAAALPNLLWSTAAAGTPTAGPTMSPYVVAGTSYGANYAVNKATGAVAPAAATTLVTSPITAACVACHDGAAARAHMTGTGGGTFYGPRGTATAVEQCLLCHGAGKVAPIADVHR